MPKIDPERLLQDLRSLRAFGAYKTGVHRPTYSPIDMAARKWTAQKMQEAGLVPVLDGIGNVIGRREACRGRRLLIGSHTETQPYAGWLDGALGVVYGIEVTRALGEDPDCRDLGIEVISFADEEGHFGSFNGSRSFIGELTEEQIDEARNRYDGGTLRDALSEAGLAGRPREQIEPERYVGYLEAHIEQGDNLESSGLTIGIVTSIVGIWQYRITFEGVQNHAGTTRMAIRKDAGVALVRLCGAIQDRFPDIAGPRSVWTIGKITLDPGAASIIPGAAEMLFQFRDADPDTLNRLEATLQDLVATADRTGPCRVRLETLSRSIPVVMDERFQTALEAAAEAHYPGKHARMPSAAGHDAQLVARRIPAGMLFVPSIGGISHHWVENTADADIVAGCQVLATAAERILKAE
jgi:beta-ureidopropionase / N-carbamoyl-L-amino-acid hydrolase